jgi:hypothetical protein
MSTTAMVIMIVIGILIGATIAMIGNDVIIVGGGNRIVIESIMATFSAAGMMVLLLPPLLMPVQVSVLIANVRLMRPQNGWVLRY